MSTGSGMTGQFIQVSLYLERSGDVQLNLEISRPAGYIFHRCGNATIAQPLRTSSKNDLWRPGTFNKNLLSRSADAGYPNSTRDR